MLHPDVKEYINKLEDKENIKKHFKKLKEEPYNVDGSLDVKKLKGKKQNMYRFRVGNHRFEYFVDNQKIWVTKAFKRGKGYR